MSVLYECRGLQVSSRMVPGTQKLISSGPAMVRMSGAVSLSYDSYLHATTTWDHAGPCGYNINATPD